MNEYTIHTFEWFFDVLNIIIEIVTKKNDRSTKIIFTLNADEDDVFLLHPLANH